MHIEVDWQAIERDVAEMTRAQSEEGDAEEQSVGFRAWVSLPALGRLASRDVVSTAAVRLWAGGSWIALPTTGGTYLAVNRPDWRADLTDLARLLDRPGATITAPPTAVRPPEGDRVRAAAVLAFRMDPPVSAGPRDRWDTPIRRWGVPASQTQRLVTDAVRWASAIGDAGNVQTVPATPDDAAEIRLETLRYGNWHHNLFFRNDTAPISCRSVALGHFGLSSWVEMHRDESPAAEARALIDVMTAHAELVDYARIGPTAGLLTVDLDSELDTNWFKDRDLWTDYVHNPYSAQLLTSAHLDKLTDKTNWEITDVAPDRWLVVSKDFDDWWHGTRLHIAHTARGLNTELARRSAAEFGSLVYPLREVV